MSARGSAGSVASGYGIPGRSASAVPGALPSYSSGSQPGAPGGYAGHGRSPAEQATHQEAMRKQQLALQQAAELRQVLSGLEKVDDQDRRSSMLDTLCAVDDILSLPEHPNPPGIASGELRNNLLKHQASLLQISVPAIH
jgi:SWI/SNF-related matrix-associated actin-dependent regulator of chromatin subfamily A3